MRINIIRIIIFSLFIITGFNLVYMQIIKGPYYYNLGKNNRIRVVPIEGRRGRIFDRNGVVLADNRISFNVMVVPQEIKDEEKLFQYLGEVLERDSQELLKRFQQKILTPFAPVVVAENIRRDLAMVLEENKFRFPSLLIEIGSQRWYPHKKIGAHVLGYVGKINSAKIQKLKGYGYTPQSVVGYSGIEEFYDQYLRGKKGGVQVEVNSRGQQVRLLSFKEPLKGEDVVLTIDQRIQEISFDILRGRTGTIIVLDLENGEVLGLASSPSFDPNIFIQGNRREASKLFVDKRSPLLNRAISGQYPPGSVFKVPVALAGLQLKEITPHTSFVCPGYYRLGQRKFRCTHEHGPQDLRAAMVHSCNVYFYNLGLMIGPESIHKFARTLGLGNKTGIDLPYEASGKIPHPTQAKSPGNRGWYKGDTLNFSIGQGKVLTTPLQLVQMMSGIALKGAFVSPYLLKSIGEQSVSAWSEPKTIDFAPQTFAVIQEGLRGVVKDYSGTGHVLDITGLVVSGKTGTAQTSGDLSDHAWFVGYSLSKNSKIVFCVFLEHGGSSQNACLLARDLLIRMQKEEIL